MFCLLGVLVNSGGSFKVTDLEDTAERIDNAFDKAIADHEKKMKKFAKDNEKEDECKYSNIFVDHHLSLQDKVYDYSYHVPHKYLCQMFFLLLLLQLLLRIVHILSVVVSAETRKLMEQIMANAEGTDEVNSRVAALLAGSSLTTTKGASKVNGREIDMVQYDGGKLELLIKKLRS